MLAFIFIDFCDPTELVIPTRGLQELSRVVHDPCLTQLIRQESCLVICRVDQQGSTVVVCLCLYVVFVLEEESDDTDVYLQFFLIWYGSMPEGV